MVDFGSFSGAQFPGPLFATSMGKVGKAKTHFRLIVSACLPLDFSAVDKILFLFAPLSTSAASAVVGRRKLLTSPWCMRFSLQATHTSHEFPLYFFAFPILATLAKHFPHCHRNQYAFVASPWQVSKVPQMQLCHRFSTHRRRPLFRPTCRWSEFSCHIFNLCRFALVRRKRL